MSEADTEADEEVPYHLWNSNIILSKKVFHWSLLWAILIQATHQIVPFEY
jgi:hypothetical protein